MSAGGRLRGDPDARRFLPHLGHWAADVVVDGHGTLYAAWHVHGAAADLEDAQTVTRRWLADNKAEHGYADERVELWDHYTCQVGQGMRALPPVDDWYGARADAAYRAMPANADLAARDLWVTLVMHRRSGLLAQAGVAFSAPRRFVSPSAWHVREFRDLARAVEEGLRRYGARRLGLRANDAGVRFSEAFEAWHLIANNRFRPCPISAGPMGRAIVPEPPAFGDARSRELLIPRDGAPVHAAVLTLLDYPEQARPYMFDALREMHCGMTLTSARRYRGKLREMNRLTNLFTAGRAGEHPAMEGHPLVDAATKIVGAKAAIEAGRAVPVEHQWLCTLFDPDLDALDAHVARAKGLLENAGVTVHRQGTAIKSAWHATIPGNLRHSPCSAPVKSVEAVAFSARHNVARGADKGRWGPPLLMLKTTAATEYGFHFHVTGVEGFAAEDLANTKVVGAPGSGKTTLVAALAGFGAQRIPKMRSVFIDNQLGLSVFTEAMGGSYLEFRPGEPCLALLPSLPDTLKAAGHAKRVLLGCMLQDGKGPLAAHEMRRLIRGVENQLRMPPHLRSIAGVHAFLPSRVRADGVDSAADRLLPWCRGQDNGWALDAECDPLDLSRRVMGFDTTELLKLPDICGPVMADLLYRISGLVNGDPIVLVIDEAWQIRLVPELQKEVKHALATIRKREGAVVLATQMAETYHADPEAAAAFRNQVPTSIYFGDAGASYDTFVHGEKLTEAEFEVLTEVLPNKAHSFLLKRPGFSAVCTFDLSGAMEHVAVLSAREKTYGFMRHLQTLHGRDPAAWVPRYMQEAPRLAADPLAEFRPAALPEAAE